MEPGARGAPSRWGRGEQECAAGGRRRWWGTAERSRGRRWGRVRRGRAAGRRWWWLDPGPGRSDPAFDRPGGAHHPQESHGPRAAGRGTGREGLVTASLVVLLALQVGTPPLDVTARVDRGRIVLGDEIGLTVRARARTAEPVSLELPPLTGFLVLSTHELTDVSVGGAGAPVRTTVRELQLRATKVGTLVIGSVHARQGRVRVGGVRRADDFFLLQSGGALRVAERLGDDRRAAPAGRGAPGRRPAGDGTGARPRCGRATGRRARRRATRGDDHGRGRRQRGAVAGAVAALAAGLPPLPGRARRADRLARREDFREQGVPLPRRAGLRGHA